MHRASLLAVCGLFAGAANAAALTYDQTLDLADHTAPTLTASALAVKAATSAAIAAGRLPDPKASVQVNDYPISGPLAGRPGLDNFSMVTFGLSQQVPNVAKRRAGRAPGRADITEAQAQALLDRRKVRIAAGLAWIDVYYGERRLAALGEIDRALAPLRQTAPARLASGSANPSDTLEPEQLIAALADRRAGLVADLAKARAELGRWVEGGQAVEPSGAPPSMTLDAPSLRAGIDDLPDLRVKTASIGRAEADAAVASAKKRPDWGYELDYSHRDPRFGDYVSATVSVSLPIFGTTRQDPVIAARRADVNRDLAEREQTRRDLAAGLDSALADHAMHEERLDRVRRTLAPLAEKRARLETASYAAGTAGLANVLQAFLAFAEVRISVIDREAEVARDNARIALTYGSDTP
jgi:cobalt-zinc-cadmium efflux system outer membrane protein